MERRIEILYDFDFAAFEYYKEGLNHHPSLRFSGNDETYYPLRAIKERDNIESLYLLSGGMDKVCIADSLSKKCFVIEPCSALFFICKMEETFQYFSFEKKKGHSNIMNGGIIMDESLFRVDGDRYEDELHVGITFNLTTDGWNITFGRVGRDIILRLPLHLFLSAYFQFGERMIRFYDHVLPEYKNFTYQYPLFIKAVRDSVIKEHFEVKPQSSYDDLTYYDYQ